MVQDGQLAECFCERSSWIISTSYYGGIGTFVGLGPTLLSDVTDGCGPGTAHQLASVTTAICLESSRQS